MIVTWAPRQTAAPGRVGTVAGACFGAAPGTVIRGSLRSAYRDWDSRSARLDPIGFRLVQDK